MQNGYFFVAGISTGSMFEGNLIYKSKSTTNLKQVDADVSALFSIGPFSVADGHSYKKIATKAGGDTSFKSTLNATGSSNKIWNNNEIFESHEKWQHSILTD